MNFADRYRQTFGSSSKVAIPVAPEVCGDKAGCKAAGVCAETDFCKEAEKCVETPMCVAPSCVEVDDVFIFEVKTNAIFRLLREIHAEAITIFGKADSKDAESINMATRIGAEAIFSRWAPDSVIDPPMYLTAEDAVRAGDPDGLLVSDILPGHIFKIIAGLQSLDGGARQTAQDFHRPGASSDAGSAVERVREPASPIPGDGLRAPGKHPVLPDDPSRDPTSVPQPEPSTS